ncbi:hypothetical protein KIN20_022445 [Parelaphostrongylus tenuis]|uniref:Uncharacterized protein n=1 Tax=Parelaphostrongylus tenuis TaxID=148309 RepID=A0AAD5QVD0_PARTN|nr:hypothetical protein KIN20_022445 [Parelaphostrongylus tenuis]
MGFPWLCSTRSGALPKRVAGAQASFVPKSVYNLPKSAELFEAIAVLFEKAGRKKLQILFMERLRYYQKVFMEFKNAYVHLSTIEATTECECKRITAINLALTRAMCQRDAKNHAKALVRRAVPP